MGYSEKKPDDPQFCKITVAEAEKLQKIISKHNSLWAIAVCAYNLGRHSALKGVVLK